MTNAAWPQPDESVMQLARTGNVQAVSELLHTYRGPLKAVIRTRLDSRLTRRLDESDVANDVLAAAYNLIPTWLEEGKSIYACLRTLARDRLSKIYRDEVKAQKRSVTREAQGFDVISNQSVLHLCARLGGRERSPSAAVMRREMRDRVRQALDGLAEIDREVVVMRALEGVPSREIGAVLSISEHAVNMRYLRAIQRLRQIVNPPTEEP